MAALGTRELVLTLDGEDVSLQISNCRIVSAAAESDFLTFAEARAGGGRDYSLQGVASQDMAEGSVWDLIWSNAGETVPAVIKPNGGVAASATTPVFTGNVVITEPDGDILGGEANASTSAKFTVEINWPYTAKPVRTIA